MAKKMNPGADATLVNVAYRAALANTPADYGKTLQSSVDSYEKTMEASADMWGNIAMIGATIGKEMIDSAQEVTDSIALGNTLNPEDAKMFTDEIYSLKDELKDLGTFNGQFGDRETRQKRAEIKIRQKELFAEIDGAVLNLKAGSEAIAAGTLDQNLLGIGEQEKLNAIVKSNTKNKVTEGGNVAKLSRDETTGELVYKLYNSETGLPFELGGKHQTMTLKQFNESIATNVGDGGAMGNNLDKYNNQRSTLGSKSKNGVYDEELKQADLNYIDKLLGNKPVDLKRAMKTKFGFSSTSFFDDITKNQGEHSADLYNTLLQATGGGDVLTGGVTDGMTDTDGIEGISQKEAMNPENYKILTANIVGLKDPEATKDYFKEYAVKEMEAAYKYGYSKKPPVAGSDGGGDNLDGIDFYSKGKGVKLYNNQILTGSSAESFYTAIRDGVTFEEKDPISKENTEYSYQIVGGEGGWYENFGEGDTPESVQYIGSGADLASRFTTDQRFRGLKTTVEERVSLEGVDNASETRPQGDYSKSIRKIDIKTLELDDNDVANTLSSYLPPVRSTKNPKGYVFYTTQDIQGFSYGLEKGGGDFSKESATLYQTANKGEKFAFMGPDGYHIKPVAGTTIKVGGNLERRRKAIENIDVLFDGILKNIMLEKPRPTDK